MDSEEVIPRRSWRHQRTSAGPKLKTEKQRLLYERHNRAVDLLARGHHECQTFIHAQEKSKQKRNLLFFSSMVLNSLRP